MQRFSSTLLVIVSLFPQTPLLGQNPKHETDKGADDIISLVRNELTNAILQLEKKMPKEQQLQVLAEMRLRVESLRGEDRAIATMEVANEYRRLRFPDEAQRLYRDILTISDSPNLLIEVNQILAQMAFVNGGSANRAIQYSEKAVDIAKKNSFDQLTATLLIQTGSYYFINEQPMEMKSCFDEFNSLPAEIKDNDPRGYLKSNLYVARELSHIDPEEANRYRNRALDVLRRFPNKFDSDLILSVELENGSGVSNWNDPERIGQLVKLFNDKRYSKEPRICDVGSQIFWAYFVERQQEPRRFEEFAKSLVKKFDSFHEKLDSLDIHQRSSLVSIAPQTIGAYAFVCDEQQLKFDRKHLAKQAKLWIEEESQLSGKFPSGATRKQISSFVSAVRKGTSDVLEIDTRQNLEPDDEPTPTPLQPGKLPNDR